MSDLGGRTNSFADGEAMQRFLADAAERKQRFIDEIMGLPESNPWNVPTYVGPIEDDHGPAMTYRQIKAAASGEPIDGEGPR